MKDKRGIYIHIPFCRRFCFYCNFSKISLSDYSISEYTDSLKKEIELKKSDDFLIDSVYFGGGSPSIVEANIISDIITKISSSFHMTDSCEITIELNPEDIEKNKLCSYKESGINRISLGIQSFKDEDLKALERSHTGREGLESLKLVKDAGFENVSIDLIIGIPGQGEKSIEKNLKTAKDFGVTHISSYILEGKKAFRKFRAEPEEQAKIYDYTRKLFTREGFEHYEVSNFCRNKKRSVHNMKYWKGMKYLGCGLSSSEYDGRKERKNFSTINEYLGSLERGFLPVENVIKPDIRTRKIVTGLRLLEGINLQLLSNKEKVVKELLSQKILVKKGGNIAVSPDKLSVLNEVILKLI